MEKNWFEGLDDPNVEAYVLEEDNDEESGAKGKQAPQNNARRKLSEVEQQEAPGEFPASKEATLNSKGFEGGMFGEGMQERHPRGAQGRRSLNAVNEVRSRRRWDVQEGCADILQTRYNATVN